MFSLSTWPFATAKLKHVECYGQRNSLRNPFPLTLDHFFIAQFRSTGNNLNAVGNLFSEAPVGKQDRPSRYKVTAPNERILIDVNCDWNFMFLLAYTNQPYAASSTLHQKSETSAADAVLVLASSWYEYCLRARVKV